MLDDLPIKFIAEHDHVFESVGGQLLIPTAVVPDLCLAKEVKPRLMDNRCPRRLNIGPEENRGSEDTFECTYESSVLFATLGHAENVQHLGGGFEANRLTLLSNGQGRQEYRNDPVLTKWKTVPRMACDL